MQKLDIYKLGANIDIKATHNGENVVAYIYTRGKQYADKMLGMKTKNVCLTKKDKLRMAGILVVEEGKNFQACCYAKTLFEKIEAERKKGGKVYAKEIADNLDKELRRRPVSYFISHDAEDEDKYLAHHAILGAKAFSRLKEDERDEVLEGIIHKEHQRNL